MREILKTRRDVHNDISVAKEYLFNRDNIITILEKMMTREVGMLSRQRTLIPIVDICGWGVNNSVREDIRRRYGYKGPILLGRA